MKGNTKALTLLGVLMAVEIILSTTPLGFIPLGFMNATTVHLPVIVGAIFLGPIGGGILGLAFGIMSIINSTTAPLITSFVFSPFVTIGGFSGNIYSVIIAIVPRVLIGVVAYYTYRVCTKFKVKDVLTYALCGLIGSLTNTIFVLGGIYIFFGDQYAAAIGTEASVLFTFMMGVVAMNGIPEAIVAAVIVTLLCKVLKVVFRSDYKLA